MGDDDGKGGKNDNDDKDDNYDDCGNDDKDDDGDGDGDGDDDNEDDAYSEGPPLVAYTGRLKFKILLLTYKCLHSQGPPSCVT